MQRPRKSAKKKLSVLKTFQIGCRQLKKVQCFNTFLAINYLRLEWKKVQEIFLINEEKPIFVILLFFEIANFIANKGGIEKLH